MSDKLTLFKAEFKLSAGDACLEVFDVDESYIFPDSHDDAGREQYMRLVLPAGRLIMLESTAGALLAACAHFVDFRYSYVRGMRDSVIAFGDWNQVETGISFEAKSTYQTAVMTTCVADSANGSSYERRSILNAEPISFILNVIDAGEMMIQLAQAIQACVKQQYLLPSQKVPAA